MTSVYEHLNAIEAAQREARNKIREFGRIREITLQYNVQIDTHAREINAAVRNLKFNQTPFVRRELDYACELLGIAVRTFEETPEFERAKEILIRYS